MYFPWSEGFTGRTELHETTLFQRALICDALLEAQASGIVVEAARLQEHIDSLVDQRAMDIRGGWRYFPTLPEHPADTDTLAQIIQVLSRSKYGRISDLCNKAIELLFKHNSSLDGSFSTWIIDPDSKEAIDKRIIWAVINHFGKGADVEVVANMLFSLWQYNSKTYYHRIEKGVEFLVNQQDPGGYWKSTWYPGPFYGTYVATRIISLFQPSSPTILKSYAYIVSQQHPDKGWGITNVTPQDTALALLALSYINLTPLTVDPIIIQKGTNFLLSTQQKDGSWCANDFIQNDVNRVRVQAGLGNPNILTYRSATITTAICLKALCRVVATELC